MIPRALSYKLRDLLLQFPIVALMGPRQSGKTTLARQLLPDYTYVNLEMPDVLDFAESDPRGFLNRYQGRVILDEVQNVPHLFSYLQGVTDERKTRGEYLLTDSQNFLLMERISQSLAGRVALINLLPFSFMELKKTSFQPDGWESFILNGGYPRIYDQRMNPSDFYPNYIQTYVERDVRKLINVGNLTLFRQFIHLLAGRVGQELNKSNLATDLGITANTVSAWLSVLEASFIVYRLPPYYKNFNKRVIKSPKIFFYDTGLACSVLGIRSMTDLQAHFSRGSLFENVVINEVMKQLYNRGDRQQLYFWKDSNRNEVDLLLDLNNRLNAIEIKSGMTIQKDFFKGLNRLEELAPNVDKHLIYGGDDDYVRNDTHVTGFGKMDALFNKWLP